MFRVDGSGYRGSYCVEITGAAVVLRSHSRSGFRHVACAIGGVTRGAWFA